MYSTDGHLPVAEVPGGTTFLCYGPPMTGKRDLAFSLLAAGHGRDAAVVISTDSGAAVTRSDYEQFLPAGASADGLGVVDCTGEHSGQGSPLVETASSPADLTGVGVGTTTLMERLYDETGQNRFRIALCSLTSAFLYADPQRVLKFVHVLIQRVKDADAFAVLVVQPDSVSDSVFNQLKVLVDGTVELRETTDGDTECSVRGPPDAPDEWVTVDLYRTRRTETGSQSSDHGEAGTEIEAGDWAAEGRSGDEWTAGEGEVGGYESLTEVIETVERERPTLTVYNYGGDPETLATLADHCETMNVGFREGVADPDGPADVALLHRGSDLIEAAPIRSLLGALEVSDSPADLGDRAGSDGAALLADLSRSTFGARGASKSFLIDVSHVIEMEAWRTGAGELHAGFQELSRLWTDPESRRIYRRLAESGVDVHVYGVPATESPDWDGVTVHELDTDEIRASWFVAYDGGGDPDRKATLLVEERDPGTYTGFWTYRADRTDGAMAYLDATYGGDSDAGETADHDTTAP